MALGKSLDGVGRRIMSVLFKSKEWFSIKETGEYLSIEFNEQIKELDVLRLVLDRWMNLSVYFFNEVRGQIGTAVSREDLIDDDFVVMVMPFDDKPSKCLFLTELANDRWLRNDLGNGIGKSKLQFTEGLWDLELSENGLFEIEHLYQISLNGISIEKESLVGITLTRGEKTLILSQPFYKTRKEAKEAHDKANEIFQQKIAELSEDEQERLKNKWRENGRPETIEFKFDFYDESNWYPSPSIPNDAVLCIRKSEIVRFIETQKEPTSDQQTLTQRPTPISDQHRENLMQQIRANGLEPLELTEGKGGKAGSKSQLKSILVPDTMTNSQFEKTWESAMRDKEIQYKK